MGTAPLSMCIIFVNISVRLFYVILYNDTSIYVLQRISCHGWQLQLVTSSKTEQKLSDIVKCVEKIWDMEEHPNLKWIRSNQKLNVKMYLDESIYPSIPI